MFCDIPTSKKYFISLYLAQENMFSKNNSEFRNTVVMNVADKAQNSLALTADVRKRRKTHVQHQYKNTNITYTSHEQRAQSTQSSDCLKQTAETSRLVTPAVLSPASTAVTRSYSVCNRLIWFLIKLSDM